MIIMTTSARTTITIPKELLERLKIQAFHEKKSISELIRQGVSLIVDYDKTEAGKGISKLIGKYAVKGKRGEFKRKVFYDKIIRKNLSY
jgi:metal-responsive CopG/Arc/MetJ family transcriptional regulator